MDPILSVNQFTDNPLRRSDLHKRIVESELMAKKTVVASNVVRVTGR